MKIQIIDGGSHLLVTTPLGDLPLNVRSMQRLCHEIETWVRRYDDLSLVYKHLSDELDAHKKEILRLRELQNDNGPQGKVKGR